MYLEIVSPEATLFKGEVIAVTLPGVDGEFQILKNHAPIISLLQQGRIKIKGNVAVEEVHQDKFSKAANGDTALHINSGTVEMRNNRIIVLVD